MMGDYNLPDGMRATDIPDPGAAQRAILDLAAERDAALDTIAALELEVARLNARLAEVDVDGELGRNVRTLAAEAFSRNLVVQLWPHIGTVTLSPSDVAHLSPVAYVGPGLDDAVREAAAQLTQEPKP